MLYVLVRMYTRSVYLGLITTIQYYEVISVIFDKSHALGFFMHRDGIFRGLTVARPLSSPA